MVREHKFIRPDKFFLTLLFKQIRWSSLIFLNGTIYFFTNHLIVRFKKNSITCNAYTLFQIVFDIAFANLLFLTGRERARIGSTEGGLVYATGARARHCLLKQIPTNSLCQEWQPQRLDNKKNATNIAINKYYPTSIRFVEGHGYITGYWIWLETHYQLISKKIYSSI